MHAERHHKVEAWKPPHRRDIVHPFVELFLQLRGREPQVVGHFHAAVHSDGLLLDLRMRINSDLPGARPLHFHYYMFKTRQQ